MTSEENRADLQRHADDFRNRTGFTYRARTGEPDVIGCVYISAADRIEPGALGRASQAARQLSGVS